MLRKMLVAVFVVVIATMSLAVFANGEYYDIGSNPMDSSRPPNPQTEAIVKLASDSPIISMIGGGGAVATGKRLKAGELVVVDKATHVAKWVARCGNEITAPTGWIPQGLVMGLEGSTPASTPAQAAAPAEQPAPPQQVDVNVNVHHDEEAPPQQTADYQQQSVVYSPEAQPGFWDMVEQSFVQALASGLGQGLAYRMVWGGGQGYGYGGYGYAPVVYYPPPAYYGGGGGGVFITKYVTKNVYINSFNSSTTTITNPGGPRGGGGTGGGPINPSDPGDTGSGITGSTGGTPVGPSSLQAQNSRGERATAAGGTWPGSGSRQGAVQQGRAVRQPLTESQIARDFRGQSGARPQAHGPTVGNGAWRGEISRQGAVQQGRAVRQPLTDTRYRQTVPQGYQGGRIAHGPTVGNQTRQAIPQQNQLRYGTQPSRGFAAAPRAPQPRQQYRAPAYSSPAPRFSAPSRPAPAFRGGGYTRPSAPAFRGGGGGGRFRR